MYKWLRWKFEDRSIAEMSIWYSITAVVSFMVMFFLWGWFTGIASGTEEYDEGALNLLFLLGTLFLWFIFLAWFARCKIPLHAYLEIGSIILMIAVQVWVVI